MRSNKNTRAVVVGVFVFIGLAIFVLTVLILGGQRKTFSKSVVIKAVFDDVSGLQRGNNIWFSGVKIGTVKKIAFFGKSQVEVDMDIEAESAKFIRKNAKAKIGQEGMIGNKIIVIEPGNGDAAPVETGNQLAVERSVNPEEMMNTFQANNKNLLEITNDFKVVSKGIVEGNGTVGKLLSDQTLFNELQTTMAMLQKSARNAEILSQDVAAFTGRLDKKGTLINDVVTDTTIYRRLRNAVSDIETISETANGVLADLKNTSNQVNADLNNPDAPAGMLLKDEKTAAQIKDILKNLQSSSIKLDEDLEAVQHNFLFRGYFRKKAKREAEEKAKQQ